MNKLLFLLLIPIFALFANSEVMYTKFIDNQIKLTEEINENNITQKKIESIVKLQEKAYEESLDVLMANKNDFISETNLYATEIFSLKKIMSINKRAGNKNAYLRDEIKLKSYQIIRNQNLMLREILLSLNNNDIEEFEDGLNKAVNKNQQLMSKIYNKDYRYIQNMSSTSRTIMKVKNNLKEYYALKDINIDMINNIYKLKNKMYRLNKYTNYHAINIVLYINNLSLVKSINPLLESYGLTVVKIIFIIFLIAMIYFFRKIVYVALQSYILTIGIFTQYSKEILEKLSKPINFIVIFINLNMIIYVYNDFSSVDEISKFFNITYTFFVTYVVYRVINTIATIKLTEINNDNKVKNEMINVGIKILNFIIVLIGVLFMLFFAGINLTAVLSGLGIGGFAVAFAAKDTISNFFGTLSILFSDVFSQGDWIVVGNDEGVVVEIGLRVTTLRTFDNALIAIPNGTFATVDVKNWNRRTLGRRIKMSIGIKYNSKSKDIRSAISQIRVMLDKHSGIATINTKYEYRGRHGAKLLSKDDHEGVKKTLLVYLDEFAPSSMNIMVYCFSKTVDWQGWLEIKEDVMYKIMDILEKNSLEFAFPSLSLYHENNKEITSDN